MEPKARSLVKTNDASGVSSFFLRQPFLIGYLIVLSPGWIYSSD
ncbi:hypothetical protein CARN8_2430007 [mine drainage metagenome]|uniref:Uncharacterized protein n=1 Tax=mine drainage metagenome TaxID=410659 RepID=A0A3P3ZN05_9ZZZZ